MSIFNQSIVRVRAGERQDRAGNTLADWSNVSRETIDRLSVQPSTQQETEDSTSNRQFTAYRVISEPGTVPDITAADRIEYRDKTYRVEGEVAVWPGFEGEDHVEFLIRTAGSI